MYSNYVTRLFGPNETSLPSNIIKEVTRLAHANQGVDEMNRCILMGVTGPCILEDLVLILDSFLVPLLQDGSEAVSGEEIGRDKTMLEEEGAFLRTGKPVAKELVKFGKQLQSSASSDSLLIENESVCQKSILSLSFSRKNTFVSLKTLRAICHADEVPLVIPVVERGTKYHSCTAGYRQGK